MYTAVVLSEKSRNELLPLIDQEYLTEHGFQTKNAQGNPLVHHVTLNMGDFDEKINDIELNYNEIYFKVIGIAKDSKVIAFEIAYEEDPVGSSFGQPIIRSSNKVPHITAAINPANGGKPFDSNKLFLEGREDVVRVELNECIPVHGQVKVLH